MISYNVAKRQIEKLERQICDHDNFVASGGSVGKDNRGIIESYSGVMDDHLEDFPMSLRLVAKRAINRAERTLGNL